MTTLTLRGVTAGYRDLTVLHDLDVDLAGGSITTILGGNGAGKSTLLKTIVGLVRPTAGTVHYAGQDITGMRCHKLASRGIRLMLQGHPVVGTLSVQDNILLGGEYPRTSQAAQYDRLGVVMDMFPRLAERRDVRASSLSGGERAMLAMARALMASPKVILMDEPSVGLSPIVRGVVAEAIARVSSQGTTIGIVEQNAKWALGLADHGVVLRNGRIAVDGPAKELQDDERVAAAYLGYG